MHRFTDAEGPYKEAVAILRELAAQNPGVYQPKLAATLSNLGDLYGGMHRFADAEAALKGAADIRRDLAAQYPTVYMGGLLITLANLYSMYREEHRDTDAKAVKAEVLAVAQKISSPPRSGNRKHRQHQKQTMKTKTAGLLVVGLFAFAAKTPLVAAEIAQTTGGRGWCSPAQNGNGNTVVQRRRPSRRALPQ